MQKYGDSSRHWSDNLPELFEEHIRIANQIENKSLKQLKGSEIYSNFLNISSFINSLVLDGGEVLDIMGPYLQLQEYNEKLEEKIEKQKKIYQTLKDLYQNKKRGENDSKIVEIDASKNKIRKLEKIIQGKQGTILDEIREAIR